jgi:hypothetical protein
MQPDSLKLTAKLSVLRQLHLAASRIEDEYGDKATEKKMFLSGVQGVVSKHCAERDYDYLLARVREVREYMGDNFVHTQVA